MDTAKTIYLNDYIYLVGGYIHHEGEVGEDFKQCGPVNEYKYGFISRDFYSLDATGTNSSVGWDFNFGAFELTMGCVVAHQDRYIYYIGGFHSYNR